MGNFKPFDERNGVLRRYQLDMIIYACEELKAILHSRGLWKPSTT